MTDCAYLNESVFDGDKFNEKFLEGFIKDCDLFIGLVTPTLVSRIMSNNNLTEFKQNFENELKNLKDVNNDINLRAKAMYNIIELCEENNNALKVTNFSFDKKNLCLNLFEPENKEKLKTIKTEIFEKINYIKGFKAVLITYDDFVPNIKYEGNEGRPYTFYRYIDEDNIFYSENGKEYGNLKGYYDDCKQGDDDDGSEHCANNTFEFSKYPKVVISKTKIDRVFYIKDTQPTSSGGRTRKTRKPKTTRKPKITRKKTRRNKKSKLNKRK